MQISENSERSKLHRQFLKQLPRVRNGTADDMVLAELTQIHLKTHVWQQVVCSHDRAVKMPNSRLLKIAMIDGIQLQTPEQPCAGFAEKLLEIKCLSFSCYIAKALMRRDHVFLRLWMWQTYIAHHQKEAMHSALYNN